MNVRKLMATEVKILMLAKDKNLSPEAADAALLPIPAMQMLEHLRQMGLLETPLTESGTPMTRFVTLSEQGAKLLAKYQDGTLKAAADPREHERIKPKDYFAGGGEGDEGGEAGGGEPEGKKAGAPAPKGTTAKPPKGVGVKVSVR